jgi:hypothetical protein
LIPFFFETIIQAFLVVGLSVVFFNKYVANSQQVNRVLRNWAIALFWYSIFIIFYSKILLLVLVMQSITRLIIAGTVAAYFISAIGTLRLRYWSRILVIAVSVPLCLVFLSGSLYLCYSRFAHPTTGWFKDLDLIFAAYFLPFWLPPMIFAIIFSKAKIKEQFK